VSAVLGGLVLAVCALFTLGLVVAGFIVVGDHTRHKIRRWRATGG
jgi:hypothetical protein